MGEDSCRVEHSLVAAVHVGLGGLKHAPAILGRVRDEDVELLRLLRTPLGGRLHLQPHLTHARTHTRRWEERRLELCGFVADTCCALTLPELLPLLLKIESSLELPSDFSFELQLLPLGEVPPPAAEPRSRRSVPDDFCRPSEGCCCDRKGRGQCGAHGRRKHKGAPEPSAASRAPRR